MLNQVSVFAENQEGGLYKITSVLAKANINIYTMLANDSAEFGIVRLIVNDGDKALEALKEAEELFIPNYVEKAQQPIEYKVK